MFVELTRYSPAVGLHAAVTLRLEFPVAGRAVAALSIRPFALRRLSAGLSLPLLTTVCFTLLAPSPVHPDPAHTLSPTPALTPAEEILSTPHPQCVLTRPRPRPRR